MKTQHRSFSEFEADAKAQGFDEVIEQIGRAHV